MDKVEFGRALIPSVAVNRGGSEMGISGLSGS